MLLDQRLHQLERLQGHAPVPIAQRRYHLRC
jgi:hypothetical protein